MKIILAFVAIALVAGLAFVFTRDEAVAPTTDAVEQQTDAEVQVEVSNEEPQVQELTEEENNALNAELEANAEVGSDVGMEFPEIDAAQQVEFTVDSFNFGYSMDEIRVKEGQVVTINLTNSDGFHDWVLDEFGAATMKIKDGETASVSFTASKKGSYEYYCSVGSHRAQGMIGTLIVE